MQAGWALCAAHRAAPQRRPAQGTSPFGPSAAPAALPLSAFSFPGLPSSIAVRVPPPGPSARSRAAPPVFRPAMSAMKAVSVCALTFGARSAVWQRGPVCESRWRKLAIGSRPGEAAQGRARPSALFYALIDRKWRLVPQPLPQAAAAEDRRPPPPNVRSRIASSAHAASLAR